MYKKLGVIGLSAIAMVVALISVSTTSVFAESPVIVGPPCEFWNYWINRAPSIAEVNQNRDHWSHIDGNDKLQDIGRSVDLVANGFAATGQYDQPRPFMSCKTDKKAYASISGTLRYDSGYGTTITIENPDGIKVLYGHLDQILVPNNTWVNAGDYIGVIGMTGMSTAVHIHFNVYKNGVRLTYNSIYSSLANQWEFGNSSEYGLIGMINTSFRYSLSPNISTPGTLISDDIQSMSSWGNRAGFLYRNGTFKIKEGMNGGAVTISENIKKFQLYRDRIGLLYQDGLFKIKDPNITTTISTGISSFQIENNWIGLLYNDGTLKVKNGLAGEIITVTASAKSFQIEGDNIGWTDMNDNLSRYNLLQKSNTVISSNVKNFQLENDRIGLLRFDGMLVIKEGLNGVTSEQSTNIAKFALEGNRIGLLYNGGTFKVRDGLNGTVVTQSENIKEFKLRGDEIYMLYNNGDYKARRGMTGPVTLLGVNIWII